MDASRRLPEGWELPAICHLQAAADEMPGILWPHAEIIRALSGLPRIEQRMEAAERAFKDRGEPWDYRAQQIFGMGRNVVVLLGQGAFLLVTFLGSELPFVPGRRRRAPRTVAVKDGRRPPRLRGA